MLRRRTLLLALAAAPALTATPSLASVRSDWAARLQRDLDRAVPPGSKTRLLLARMRLEGGGDTAMTAVVEMHWPPGLRRRSHTTRAATPETAYEALLSAILTEFAMADPAIGGTGPGVMPIIRVM